MFVFLSVCVCVCVCVCRDMFLWFKIIMDWAFGAPLKMPQEGRPTGRIMFELEMVENCPKMKVTFFVALCSGRGITPIECVVVIYTIP
jgi:hypothetical protein